MQGTYTEAGLPFQYDMTDLRNGNIIVAINNAFSEALYRLRLRPSKPGGSDGGSEGGSDGKYFFVTNSEFEHFKKYVVNTSNEWKVRDGLGNLVTIPGTWTSTSSGGRRRMSRNSRMSRKSRNSRKSRKSRKSIRRRR